MSFAIISYCPPEITADAEEIPLRPRFTVYMICNAFALKKALFMRLSGSKNGKVVYYHYAACLCVTAEIRTFHGYIKPRYKPVLCTLQPSCLKELFFCHY